MFLSGALVASSCTFTTASVNGSAVLIAGFSNDGQTATLPDPGNTTAGRVMYVTAANNSNPFTLLANVGGGENVEQHITLRQNTTATLIWNGADWTSAGASNTTSLQSAYDNSVQSTNSAYIVVNKGYNNSGLTINDDWQNPVDGTLIAVQTASAMNLFSVNTNASEYATDGTAEAAGGSSSTFPASTWSAGGGSTVERYTAGDGHVATGGASVKVVTSGASSGAYNQLNAALTPNATYNVTAYATLHSGSMNDLGVFYSADGTNISSTCQSGITVSTAGWAKISCSFTAPSSGITSQNAIAIGQTGSGSHTLYIDNLSVKLTASQTANVQIGGNGNGESTTLFTLDKSASAPSAGDGDTLLGSMYYDTTLGKVRCYEADGWGACGAAPDTYVTISPQYTNAVMNGNDIGTISSDLCSDSLNINDGSSGQPTICGTNETQNFYKWTTTESTTQTRSIYVTYQLPSNFKQFVTGTTSLMGRTNSSDSAVTYQIYRDNGSGLTSCGSAVSVSTGSQTAWQKVAATSGNDPASCGFQAGESILIRINLSAKDDANAYVSDLGFVFSNN